MSIDTGAELSGVRSQGYLLSIISDYRYTSTIPGSYALSQSQFLRTGYFAASNYWQTILQFVRSSSQAPTTAFKKQGIACLLIQHLEQSIMNCYTSANVKGRDSFYTFQRICRQQQAMSVRLLYFLQPCYNLGNLTKFSPNSLLSRQLFLNDSIAYLFPTRPKLTKIDRNYSVKEADEERQITPEAQLANTRMMSGSFQNSAGLQVD